MTRQAAAPLTRIFTVLFLLTPLAFSQTPARPGAPIKLEAMGQDELNQAARKLSRLELRQYTHRSYKLGDKGVPMLDKETAVRTLFLMRPREFMTPLPDGLYDDKQGNLVYFGDFAPRRKVSLPYSLTFTAASEVILAFDSDGDGVIDGMLGRKPGGNFWELKGDVSSPFWQCLEARFQTGIFGAAFSCWRGPDSGREGRGREGGGRTTAPGFGRDPNAFEGFVTSRSDPDCEGAQPGEFAREDQGPLKDEKELLEHARDRAREEEDRARAERKDTAARHAHQAAMHAEIALTALEYSRRAHTAEERTRYYAIYVGAREACRAECQRAESYGAGGGLGSELPGRAAPPPPRPRTVDRTAEPEYKDPRCAGRDKEIKQLGILGLAFNKDFCGDDDPITCLERAEDPIRDASQGRCHHEPGSDDSRRLVCERKGRKSDRPEPSHGPIDPTDPSRPDRGPADGAPLPVTISGPPVNYTFLEITPLGAMLAVRCTAGDGTFCPGEGMMKTRRAHP